MNALYIATGAALVIYLWFSGRVLSEQKSSKIQISAIAPTALALPEVEKPQPAPSPVIEKQKEFSCSEKLAGEVVSKEEFLRRNEAAISQTVGVWYFGSNEVEIPESDTTTAGKFFLALSKAGLLSRAFTSNEIERSLELLDEVHAVDPSNSAPLVIKAYLLNHVARYDEMSEVIQDISLTTHFNSYLKDVARAVYNAAESPSELVAANEIVLELRSPKFSSFLSGFLEYHKLKNVAKQMIGRHDIGIPGIHWILAEAVIGLRVIKRISPNEAEQVSSSDLIDRWNKATLAQQMNTALSENCSVDELTPTFEKLKESLNLRVETEIVHSAEL